MAYSAPPRKLLLHHRLILLSSGFMVQFGSFFVAAGSFFALLFGFMAETGGAILGSVFPIVGLLCVLFSLRSNFKTVDLLTNGKIAKGEVVKQQSTNVLINNEPVIEYTVRFQAEDGISYEVKGRTHLKGKVGDEPLERVLYLPADPSWGTVFDTIPNAPEFLQDGQIVPPPWWYLFLLFLPTIGTIALLGLVYTAVSSLPLLFQ
ncbi:MAG: hypothetical protein AAFQ68_17220 [Bacteroidota bacterium]